MPRRSTLTLSGRAVDGLVASAKDVIVWDRELAGFGVRVYPSGRKVYVVQSRAGGAPRRVTLGTHGEITTTQARLRAAQVIDRIKRGEEPEPPPAEAGMTIADLAGRYMSAHVAQNCNAHTAGIYRGSLENHILPALGMMPLAMVETAHVARLHYRLRATPRAANRALAVLSKMFTLAAAWGLVADGSNPCRGVRKYKETKRERFLTRDEYRRLGTVLAEADAEAAAGVEGAVSPYAIAALRLLMLTGCRLNEILTLRWDDVDRTAGEFRLRDGKTGARMVPSPPPQRRCWPASRAFLTTPGSSSASAPAPASPPSPKSGTASAPAQVLDDVRIHDLRHSYASRALAAGESLSMIGKLLGHTDIQSTARYAHLARETERASAARVGASIGADIRAEGDDPVSHDRDPAPIRATHTSRGTARSRRRAWRRSRLPGTPWSGTVRSRASASASIPPAPRSTWCRQRGLRARSASPWAATG